MKVFSIPPSGFKVFQNGKLLGKDESRVLLRKLHQKMSVPGAPRVHGVPQDYMSSSVRDSDAPKIVIDLIEGEKFTEEMMFVRAPFENVAEVQIIPGGEDHSKAGVIYSAIKRAMHNVENKTKPKVEKK